MSQIPKFDTKNLVGSNRATWMAAQLATRQWGGSADAVELNGLPEQVEFWLHRYLKDKVYRHKIYNIPDPWGTITEEFRKIPICARMPVTT